MTLRIRKARSCHYSTFERLIEKMIYVHVVFNTKSLIPEIEKSIRVEVNIK